MPPRGRSSTPSGVPAALEELITSSRPESPLFAAPPPSGGCGFSSMPRRSEKYSTYPFCATIIHTRAAAVPIVPVSHRFRLPTSISTAFITPLDVQLSSFAACVKSRVSPSRAS